MLASRDFKELLSLFKKHKVRYLVVGGYAVMRYTEPRFTKDLDVLIAADEDNASSVFDALKEFGAPLQNLTPKDFADIAKGDLVKAKIASGRPQDLLDVESLRRSSE
jgi:hypothetical protein